ncbi:MAG: thioredoxin-disulfide reductase [Solirubrobacteraceae bacterium]
MNNSIHECIIIGTGPAGYTAAIYAARANMKPIIISGLQPGGQLTTTTEVDNFPGYANGITGPEMMEDLKKQALRFGTTEVFDHVSKVNFSKEKGGFHTLFCSTNGEIKTKTVILATGATAKYLGLESEERLKGGGVSACATCDGFFYKNRDVVVVGGGDTAAEEATYLSKICNKVYLLVRKEEFRASKAMVDRVLKTANIEVLFNHEVLEILGETVVEGVSAINNITKETREITVDGVFIAIGHVPNTDIVKDFINLASDGYIITEGKSTKTNIPGVFAAGDVQDNIYRQAITAAGTGCMAALDAEKYLNSID